MARMKAVQVPRPGADFEVVKRDIPQPGPGQVRIRVLSRRPPKASADGAASDIGAVRRNGEMKYCFGLNWEQALGDGGASGVFGRLGWNDGMTESFAYAEKEGVLPMATSLWRCCALSVFGLAACLCFPVAAQHAHR